MTVLGNWVLLFILCVLAGCSGTPELMPTPNLYLDGNRDPFRDVPKALQNNRVEVLYLTDRVPEDPSGENPKYGYKRSRSIGFGVADVAFGEDVSWDELVAASRSRERSVDLKITVPKTTEHGRFPPTPRTLVELPETRPADVAFHEQVDASFEKAQRLLSSKLAASGGSDVYVFVHGYNNTFDDSVMTIAQLWHFFGRKGVPVAYSWPAGSPTLLRGYTYDRESGEFTVYHLKEMLRHIAANPDVKKIHVIAHSRGTDVATSALRELHLEISGGGRSTRDELKLATVILAAPDLDLDVVIQRLVTVRLGRVPERFVLYVCEKDQALGLSNWLFSGVRRLGQLRSNIFTPEELAALRNSKSVQIVDARVSDAGSSGHNYFHSNPAVSSDLILVIRDGLSPGERRPLRADPKGFWFIDDSYPAPTK